MKRLPDYSDPQNAPDWWVMELRTVIDTEGCEWHLVMDNDGEELLLTDEQFIAVPQGYLGKDAQVSHYPAKVESRCINTYVDEDALRGDR